MTGFGHWILTDMERVLKSTCTLGFACSLVSAVIVEKERARLARRSLEQEDGPEEQSPA